MQIYLGHCKISCCPWSDAQKHPSLMQYENMGRTFIALCEWGNSLFCNHNRKLVVPSGPLLIWVVVSWPLPVVIITPPVPSVTATVVTVAAASVLPLPASSVPIVVSATSVSSITFLTVVPSIVWPPVLREPRRDTGRWRQWFVDNLHVFGILVSVPVLELFLIVQ